jgi:lysozyme family protein
MSFEEILKIVGIAEGGFSTDRSDRGNWSTGKVGVGVFKGSKFGISGMSYPNLDIQNLTWEQAQEIYLTDFWMKYKIHLVNPAIQLFLFDSIVNHGPSGGIKLLQAAAGVAQDGVIGDQTIRASMKVTPWDFARVRSDYFVTITQNGTNDDNDRRQLKGWLRRNLNILHESIS